MSKFSYKTLLIIFLSLLIAIVVLWKFVLPKQSVKATWWNETWSYRKAVSVNNTLGSIVNNQRVKITVDTSALITSGKMQSNCNDIRITDINGNILDHWDTACNTTNTNIYFKLDSLPTSGTTIYFYYGNSSASNDEKTLGTIDNPGTSCQMMKDQGSVTANGTYYIVPGGADIDKQLVYCDQTTDGGGWALVMNQKSDTGGFFTSSTDAQSYNESNPTADRYSILGKLGKFKDNGIFTFKINWPTLNSSRNIWSQTSNPISENIAGYTAITIDHTDNAWGGIAPEGASNTFIDGSPGSPGWWFYAIASYTQYGVGIPSYSPDVTQTQLWVKGNNTMNNVSVGAPTSEEVSPAPIAYWKFDEGTGTTAYDSRGNKNGTLSGSTLPTWTSEDQCISGKCLQYNGVNNSVSIPYINLTNQFTASIWIKGSSFSNDNGLFYQCEAGATNKCMHLVIRSGKPYLGFYGYDLGSNTTLQPNVWYFITFVYDGTYQKIYINGKLDSSKTSIAYNGLSGTTFIGQAWGGGANGSFNGILDDVKIYPYARTADQIKLDYNSRGSSKGSTANLGIKSSTAPSLSSKLVAHWKLDENNNTNVYDSSSYHNNGSFGTGDSSPSWVTGKIKNAVSFDGNDYINVSNSNFYNTITKTKDFTISSWIKINSPITNDSPIVGQQSHSYLDFYINSSNRLCLTIDDGGTCANSVAISSNNWQHVTATYKGLDGSQFISFYLNGKFIGSGYDIDFNGGPTNELYIGYESRFGYTFNGLIDEVKIYNTVLTADEVKQDYNQGSTIQFGSTNQTIGGTTTSLEYCIPGDTSFCASPVAEWNFEENTGTVTKDTSGNNNNGTINGATWTTGKTGAALNFSISNTISVPNTVPISVNNKITVSYWYKKGTTNDRIINRGWCNPHGWLSHGSLGFGVNDNTGCSAQYWASYGSMTTGVWYFLTGVFDGSKVYSYKNGILISQTNAPNVNLAINNYSMDMMSGTDGQLDNIKIYDYARTPSQINYDYNKGGPIAHWKLDECQGLTAFDASGLGNTGTIFIGSSGSQTSVGTCQIGTSAAWTNGASGKINSSLNFDGTNDYVILPNTVGLGTQEFTASIWVKQKSYGQSSSSRPYMSDWNTWSAGSQKGFILRTYDVNQFPIFSLADGFNYYQISSSKIIPLNTWTHIVGVFKANSIFKIYMNGIEVGSGTAPAQYVKENTTPIYLGYSGINSGYMDGQLDDARIYNYALTPEQIKQVYNNGAINFN